MGVLRGFLHLKGIRTLRHVTPSVILGYEIPCFSYSVIRGPHRIGPHVGYKSYRPLASKLNSLVESLGNQHSLFDGEAVFFRGILLESAGYKRRQRLSFPLFLLDLSYNKILS